MFGKPLRLSYSKKESDVTAKTLGHFDESVKIERQERYEEGVQVKQLKRQRKMIKKLLILRQQIKAGPGAYKEPQRQDMPFNQLGSVDVAMQPMGEGRHQASSSLHHTLFVSDLPVNFDVRLLRDFFGHYRGLEEIRPVVVKGVAFVQFTSIPAASAALDRIKEDRDLQDTFETDKIKVSYANKG